MTYIIIACRDLHILNETELELEKEVISLLQDQERKRYLKIRLLSVEKDVITAQKRRRKMKHSVICLAHDLLGKSLMISAMVDPGSALRFSRMGSTGAGAGAGGGDNNGAAHNDQNNSQNNSPNKSAIHHTNSSGSSKLSEYAKNMKNNSMNISMNSESFRNEFSSSKDRPSDEDFISLPANSLTKNVLRTQFDDSFHDSNDTVWCIRHTDTAKKAKLFTQQMKKYLVGQNVART